MVFLESSKQGTKNFDRYHQFLVLFYLILTEIISSTIVYDQDANRSRVYTSSAGGSLEFHCYALFSVSYLLKYRFVLGSVSGIIIKKDLHLKRYTDQRINIFFEFNIFGRYVIQL